MKGPSQLLRSVYREHIDKFDEPDDSIVFGGNDPIKGMEHIPSRIEVLIWRANEDIDVNVFATIGMSDMAMNKVDYRAELHFGVRGELVDDEIFDICVFLANLAVHPFHHNTYFNWFHLFSNPGPVPCFSKATAILFQPTLTEGGWDRIETEGKLVKILKVIPIPEEERLLMKDKGYPALFDYWADNEQDLYQRW